LFGFKEESDWIISFQNIESAISQSPNRLYRLIIVIGVDSPSRSDFFRKLATRIPDCVYLNLGLEISRALKNIPSIERKQVLSHYLKETISKPDVGVLLLDRLGVLFDPDLECDPIRFLKELSRSHTVVASIGGEYVNGVLTYAEQGHSEYRRLDVGDAVIVDLGRFDR
jgi:hypothetical protein